MTSRRPINTDLDLVMAIGDVFDHLDEPDTETDKNEILREAGHDPDEVGRNTAIFVDGLIRSSRKVIAERTKTGFAEFQARMEQLELPNTRPSLIEAIQNLFTQHGPELSAQYRNFEDQTDDDLRELLRELMALNDLSEEGE